MSVISTGDRAFSFQLSQQNSALKTRLHTLSNELASGRVADLGQRVSGDYAPLTQIERSLRMMTSFELATTESALAAEAMQTSLNSINASALELSENLLLAGTTTEATIVSNTGVQARGALDDAVSKLNTQIAGRHLFGGAATDRAPLASGEDILAELKLATAGAATADDVMAIVDSWFDTAGGGFETMGYQGSTTPAGPVRLSETQSLGLSVTAADPAMREVLKTFAGAALLADGAVLSGNLDEAAKLAGTLGVDMIEAQGNIANLAAEIGTAQNRIETITAENSAERVMLELAQSEILSADPFDTAAQLQEVETQLELHYTVTARLSRLSLVDFLR